MATYNGGKFIKDQIQSILVQLSDDDELVISDDFSNDNTQEVIDSFSDNRIKFYKNLSGRGVNRNFENALKFAKGDFIFLSDQDDIWFDDKISCMMNYLQNNDVVVCDCIIVNQNLEVLAPSYFQFRESGPGFIKNLLRNTYMGNCIAFKRSILEIVIPFPKNITYHDYWIGLVSEVLFKTVFIPIPLSFHRRHEHNVSNTFDKRYYESFFKKILIRFKYFFLSFIIIKRFLIKKYNNRII